MSEVIQAQRHGDEAMTAHDVPGIKLPVNFEVVAAVLTHRGRVCLVRRSRHVKGDVGRWHCITGYLSAGESPLRQALLEIEEELGIGAGNLGLQRAAVVDQKGGDGNMWRIHAFHFDSLTEAVKLNWEHDGACWSSLWRLKTLPTVGWLGTVLKALSIVERCSGAH